MTQKKNIALVLSGGGARGLAHIGAIEVLIENGYNITSIAGTSMGSLVGGIYCLNKMEAFKEWVCSLDKLKIFRMVDFTLSKQGLVKGDKILNSMKEFIHDENIEDFAIPYSATAVDIINRKEVVFKQGSVYDAIRASISIPTVFTPVKTEHGLLVDGGVLNNVPISNVVRNDNDLLVTINVNANIPVYKPQLSNEEVKKRQTRYRKRLTEFKTHLQKINPLSSDETLGYINLIDTSLSLMMTQIAQTELEKYDPDILIETSRNTCSTFDFFKAEEIIEIGRHAAMESLERYNYVGE